VLLTLRLHLSQIGYREHQYQRNGIKTRKQLTSHSPLSRARPNFIQSRVSDNNLYEMV